VRTAARGTQRARRARGRSAGGEYRALDLGRTLLHDLSTQREGPRHTTTAVPLAVTMSMPLFAPSTS
jgi:hypothetical protein